jgi:hypothetical protein
VRTAWLPFLPRILEIADQLVLLRIDRDHGVLTLQERRGRRVDVIELGVAIGMRGPLAALAHRLQTVAQLVEQTPHRGGTHAPALRRQGRRQLRPALARPPQRRNDVKPTDVGRETPLHADLYNAAANRTFSDLM